MSAIEFNPTENEVYADPSCWYCKGTGVAHRSGSEMTYYMSYRIQCDCVKAAKANPIEINNEP